MKKHYYLLIALLFSFAPLVQGQDYFFKDYAPFDPQIPSPEEFLGYPIGDWHTRHDLIVSYLEKLAELSDRATITYYGQSHEMRKLVILNISAPEHINNLEQLRQTHVNAINPKSNDDDSGLPIFINMGYSVHGNEPSTSESALLTAYTLVASQSEAVNKFLKEAVVFVDPALNPDGRDRFTMWANTHRGTPVVDDPADIEHSEISPNGRTNHYYFDLNRDWWLGIHPESRGKLNWYHQWYPNVVTDFHEMGTNSTYFFEPMKAIASKDPIMPKENYTTLNDAFAKYFVQDLDAIGSMYFTKEVFDGTYPGYGSSYPDLQGALALLFEQASSRGHAQRQQTGELLTFAFTIRNQYVSGMATIKAAIANKKLLRDYQKQFFKSALSNAASKKIKGYVFGDPQDKSRVNAFIDKLLLHRVKVYELSKDLTVGGKQFRKGTSYVVPTSQPQYRMVQSAFETYSEFTDSVYYDASAWSLANFYNMQYSAVSALSLGSEVKSIENTITTPSKSSYAYIMPWTDYNAPAALYHLQKRGVITTAAFKPFAMGGRDYGYGTVVIPVSRQKLNSDQLFQVIKEVAAKWQVNIYSSNTGYSERGIDLGSGNLRFMRKPKVAMLVGQGVSSYEHGEVWHLMDNRVNMPITKVPMRNFGRLNLNNYDVLVMVSGGYNQIDSAGVARLRSWVAAGNTLITSRNATQWAINKKVVKESLLRDNADKKKPVERLPYVSSREHIGKKRIGGAIFEVALDITHPVGFGYWNETLPVYRNSNIWLKPSSSPFGTVAKYTDDPHIDGFITDNNLEKLLKPSASIIVSSVGRGRAILFADNPNFRGSWYGTNKLFLNAIFFGNHIQVPR